MDGTLLDATGAIPDSFWPVFHALRSHGLQVAVASGRQYASLRRLFNAEAPDMIYIAENGAHVVRDGTEVSSSPLDPALCARVVDTARALAKQRDLGLVWCGRDSAYVERDDPAFLAEARRYYSDLIPGANLNACPEEALKFSVLDLEGASDQVVESLTEAADPCNVVRASRTWVDIMDPAINKGVGIRALQQELGIPAAQTMAFGDYLNDLELMDAAHYSYAMANAHPDVIARARYRAPSNAEHGVITILARLLVTLEAA